MGKILDLYGNVLYEYEGTNIRDVNFKQADFRDADLSGIVFTRCFFSGVDFTGANLSNTVFEWCYLHHSRIRPHRIDGAIFRDVQFPFSSFVRQDFKDVVFFTDCDFTNTDFVTCENHPYIPLACPSDGAFTGWKKVTDCEDGISCLVELRIPATAKRCSATSRKCRCDKARVVRITKMRDTGSEELKEVWNKPFRLPDTLYKVGEMVYPDSYDEDRWHECSHGIHFFINKQDALDY